MSPPVRVTAVVLTYNGHALLDTIIPSLLAQSYAPVRRILIDDGSSDGSADYVRARWPEVEVIQLPQNEGITAGLNRAVMASDTEYIALLNNDLELDRNWLAALVATLDTHRDAASATGKTLSFYNRSTLDGAGDAFMWSGMVMHRGVHEPDRGQYDEPGAVFSASAGMALFRRAAFEDVGLFDGDFYAYLEDIDWGFRAQLRGWGCRYEPRALAYHMGSVTTAQNGRFFGKFQRRNQLLLVLKNYPARAFLRYWPKLALNEAGWVIGSIRDDMVRQQLQAWAEVVWGLPATFRKRREIQRGRRVGLAHLATIVSPEVYAEDTVAERIRSMARAVSPIFQRSCRGRD